jgi:hypothetical protein
MADTCYYNNCDRTAYDDCGNCGRPTCKVHGRQLGDEFRCNQCGFSNTSVRRPEFTSPHVKVEFRSKVRST